MNNTLKNDSSNKLRLIFNSNIFKNKISYIEQADKNQLNKISDLQNFKVILNSIDNFLECEISETEKEKILKIVSKIEKFEEEEEEEELKIQKSLEEDYLRSI